MTQKLQQLSLIKGYGYEISPPDVNKSQGYNWYVKDKVAYTPLVAIKGLGEAAIQQILEFRPFEAIEEILFNPNMSKTKVNKKCIDAMARCGALKSLQDERFTGDKHFWASFGVDRPQSLKKFKEVHSCIFRRKRLLKTRKIDNMVSLLGVYPIELVMNPRMIKKLLNSDIPSVGSIAKEPEEYEGPAWFIPISIEDKYTSKTSKDVLFA
jgi:hypothetical protein